MSILISLIIWALLFIVRLRFPSGKSIAKINAEWIITIFVFFSLPDKMSRILNLFIVLLAFITTISAQNYKWYTLTVTKDVTLERGSKNFNYLPYLIVGTHPGYPMKRSLMQFQNIPSDCVLPLEATLHIYFVYAHKASFLPSLPVITRNIVAHTVLKSWSESEATTTKRDCRSNWDSQWLNLGTDADPVALYSTSVTQTPGLNLH